jgi:hypothetical protein
MQFLSNVSKICKNFDLNDVGMTSSFSIIFRIPLSYTMYIIFSLRNNLPMASKRADVILRSFITRGVKFDTMAKDGKLIKNVTSFFKECTLQHKFLEMHYLLIGQQIGERSPTFSLILLI